MPSAQQETNATAFKRVLRLPPSLGDWTTFKPSRTEAKKIKAGLRGFNRLSEDDLIEAHFIHYKFAQRFLKKLRADLGISGELYSITVEQTTYQDFLKRTSQPIAQFKILIDELSGPTLFLDLSLASCLINRALGAKDTATPVRPLTMLEEIILSTLNTEEFSQLSSSFKNTFEIADFQFMGAPLLTADSFINFSETFILFVVELSLGETVSRFSVGYQYDTLKALLESYKNLPEEHTLQLNRLPSSLYDHIKVPAVAELGSTLLSTNDLSGLESGDVVSLDTLLDNLLSVLIGDRLQVLARPGVKHGKMALRVTRTRKKMTKEILPAVTEIPKPEPVEPVLEQPIEEELPLEEGYPLEEEEKMKYPFGQEPLEGEENFPLEEEEEK